MEMRGGFVYYGVALSIILLCVIGMILTVRTLNRVATSIDVQQVEPGVKCALATSSDGVALDCWQERAPR